MKKNIGRRIRRNSIKVCILNPKEGVNFERLSMALNLILREKDILDYLNKGAEILCPIPSQNGVVVKNP